MSVAFPLRPCPICSAVPRSVLYSQRFERLAKMLMAGYDVVACRKCGFVFADRLPPKKTFDRYYADASKYEFSHRAGRQEPFELERLGALARWMAGNLPSSLRVLDAGCSTGELLVRLRDLGFTDLTGLDPSASCVRYARERNGLRMIEGVLGRKRSDVRPFDVVVLSAVLEHVPDLEPFVRQALRWLGPHGYLVAEVPDACHFADGTNAPFQEFSVEHVNFFSLASLENLMGGEGLGLVASRQRICPMGPGVTGAVLTTLFRRQDRALAVRREVASQRGVRRYVAACRKRVERERRVVKELVDSRTPVVVWGTGTMCLRLLATTALGKADIRAFVDSNPHYQGKRLAGRKIVPPEALCEYPYPVVVTSWAFFDEIRLQIRRGLKLKNEIIRVHEVKRSAAPPARTRRG